MTLAYSQTTSDLVYCQQFEFNEEISVMDATDLASPVALASSDYSGLISFSSTDRTIEIYSNQNSFGGRVFAVTVTSGNEFNLQTDSFSF